MCDLRPRRLAATASMRPSWPPPKMPMVEPGGSGASGIVLDRLGDGLSLRRAEGSAACGKLLVGKREDLRREQSRVGRSCLADGERSDRNAGRHLVDRQQAVETFQGAALYGNAEHGKHS